MGLTEGAVFYGEIASRSLWVQRLFFSRSRVCESASPRPGNDFSTSSCSPLKTKDQRASETKGKIIPPPGVRYSSKWSLRLLQRREGQCG